MFDVAGALRAPLLRTPLPGPRARDFIARDGRVTSPSYTRMYPLVAKRGQGAVIEDLDGNLFLDFTAGIAVCSTGHCHPRVVAAIREQSERLIHMSGTDFYYEPQLALAEKLIEVTPGRFPKRVFFTNSGAESIEAALKLARYHTGRQQLIAFYGAFHGRTMGALSLTASKVTQRRGFAPFVPGVSHVPYPAAVQSKSSSNGVTVGDSIAAMEKLFAKTVPPSEVAAVFVEPIQGEGGYIVPPPSFHRELKALCEQHGILFVVDEVQSGMGRTGKMFAIEHWGVEPDIICLAKGVASGLPLGAIVARAEIMNWPPGAHASTFGGNPVACAAATATIDLLQETLMENAARVGDFLIRGLECIQPRFPTIGDVRGKGLMIGIELIQPDGSPAPELAGRLVHACFEKGLLILPCGISCVRLCPPLVITEEQGQTALDILVEALSETLTTISRRGATRDSSASTAS